MRLVILENNILLYRHHRQNVLRCGDFHNQYICTLQIICTVFASICDERNFARTNT